MPTEDTFDPIKLGNQVWDEFLYFECEQTAAVFLQEIFEKKGTPNAKATAFRAAPKLSYAIRQAHEYYRAAENANLLIKPLLCFYGMTCLVRAVIVKNNPDYPTSASVLKHGLSTRKLKREGYQITEDVAVIQKDGLYVVFHNLIHQGRKISTLKYRMGDLIQTIPELLNGFTSLNYQASVGELQIDDENEGCIWSVSRHLLQNGGWTKDDWLRFLNEPKDEFSYLLSPDPPGFIRVLRNSTLKYHPALSRDTNGNWYLRLPELKQSLLDEMCTHYIVMFTLGMLSRYETERWGEIVLGGYTSDAYIIQKFLNVSHSKFPLMIFGNLIRDNWI